MLIYLTSVASKTLDKLIPLLPKSPQEMTVAFIPTAGDLYQEKPWMEEDRKKLIDLGFQVEELDIKGKARDELEKSLLDKDIIFVAGGNTSYLLEKAQKSGFIELAKDLVKKGKIYVGSSAGSLLACPNIEVDKIYDDGEFGKELKSYEGLSFVDFVILPHADNPKYTSYLEKIFNQYGDKYKLKKLNDNQAFVVNNDGVELVEV
ncbi:Type 1 glutamine amidotransferase-like domain-containing protein [Candidatus Daviesbacteria bacterium]|nr:Type 1 glutamine amidotransferase-like domain-containing protein [Candidatus Daviesbacteria bacterium]